MKIRCSAPILTLNSEKTLARCLESLKDFEDIFIVDGNSTDQTHTIARRYGVPIYKQTENTEPNITIQNFSEIRGKALNYARHDWILLLDSDEYITNELKEEIRKAVEKNDATTAYAFPYVIIIDGTKVRYSFNMPRADMRFYNKKSGIYLKPGKVVHEKFFIPPSIRIETFKNEFFNESKPYHECLKKDNFYLSLARKKMLSDQTTLKKKELLISVARNFLRAWYIMIKSIIVYFKHGFKHSLPPRHVWRFMRYHFFITGYRIQQLFNKKI